MLTYKPKISIIKLKVYGTAQLNLPLHSNINNITGTNNFSKKGGSHGAVRRGGCSGCVRGWGGFLLCWSQQETHSTTWGPEAVGDITWMCRHPGGLERPSAQRWQNNEVWVVADDLLKI